ncbi:Dual specificity tyrosine-phosphorylation-regulated kinase 2 isoform 1 [Schistosoma japonicum]|uniref:dual-specificity kinase n=1 Tax=Schistosoma japonicum TaxID=6182 RepID=A0A4Z2CVH7_SCHJA|nr:Dual specificity tyrosine-phosphorylation-regulated kinase 2 [Schistosoma japonicum]TNN08272.1 Dual specificity tyrosine-phosphorylation-regulated kinase 2 isoform 1 [Schistosoma japonicum]
MHAVESMVVTPRYTKTISNENEPFLNLNCRRNKYPAIPKCRDQYYTDRVSYISCSPRQRNNRDLSRSNITGASRRSTRMFDESSLLFNPRSFLNSDLSLSCNHSHRGSSFNCSQNYGGYPLSGRLRILNQTSKNYISQSILNLSNGACNRSLRDLYKSPERHAITNRHSYLTNKTGPIHDFKSYLHPNNFERDQDIHRQYLFENVKTRDCEIEYDILPLEPSEVKQYTISSDTVKGGSLKVDNKREFNLNSFNLINQDSSIIHVKPHSVRKMADTKQPGKVSNDSAHKRLSKDLQSKSEMSYDGSCCMSGTLAVALYGSKLTEYERDEIQDYPEVYFLGLNAPKGYSHGSSISDVSYKKSSIIPNANVTGFDDAQGSYILIPNDHLAYRYEVLKPLGKGSFGHVVHAVDHCTKQQVAIKIVKSEARFTRQAVEEIRILKALNGQQSDGEYNVVHLMDHFIFRGHVCMVFELLYINLYELICRNNFKGFSQSLVRKLTYGILCCLELLYRNKVIHCDLKPENILLRRPGKSKIKVIDFGSSCFINECPYNYIQSRFYRAPEIILGLPYGTAIDMWSLGCILAEFITGEPLFPGEDAFDQLACIMEILGIPPMQMIKKGSQSRHYFNSNGQPLYMIEQQRHAYGNEQSDKTKEALVNLSKSLHSSSIKTKRSGSSKRQKLRKSPGSTTLVEALTCSKNSSVCLPLGDKTSNGHKIPQPLDPDMIDFLKGCLKWNPDERMNPIEALDHPWIRKMSLQSLGRTNSFLTTYNTDSNYAYNKNSTFTNGTPKQVSDTEFVASILGVRTRKHDPKLLHISRKSEVKSTILDGSISLNESCRRYSYDQNNKRLSQLFETSATSTSNSKSKNETPSDESSRKISDSYCDTKQYRSFLNNGNSTGNDKNSNDDDCSHSGSPQNDGRNRQNQNRHCSRHKSSSSSSDNAQDKDSHSHSDSNHDYTISDEIPEITVSGVHTNIQEDNDDIEVSIRDVEQNSRNSGYYDNAGNIHGNSKIIMYNEEKVILVPTSIPGEHDI